MTVEDPLGLIDAADASWLEGRLLAALGVMGVAGEARARLVDDERMSAEHERTLDDPSTTDVLTFDLSSGDLSSGGGVLDVDLLLCVDEARRQAATRAHGPREELLLYAVHGCLHCLGFDDASDRAAAAMHTREDEVLRAIGIGAVFDAAEPPVAGGSREPGLGDAPTLDGVGGVGDVGDVGGVRP
ncbi:MAG: rRNA maturation RNase YbeY [Planctomycetota bacterium]